MRITVLVTVLLGLADASSRHYTRGADGFPARRKNYEDLHYSSKGNAIRLPDIRDRELPFEGDEYDDPPMRVEFVSWDPRRGRDISVDRWDQLSGRAVAVF